MPVNKEKKYFESVSKTVGTKQLDLTFIYNKITNSSDSYSLNLLSMTNLLLGDNRMLLKDSIMNRKQDFIINDSANRQVYAWRVNLDNTILWILTAKERGTSYEYVPIECINTNEDISRADKGLLNKSNRDVIEYLRNLYDIPQLVKCYDDYMNVERDIDENLFEDSEDGFVRLTKTVRNFFAKVFQV